MAGEIYGLVIYDSRIFDQSSHVSRWAHSVAGKFGANARMYAPVNKRMRKSTWYADYPPGSLKASIETDAERVGPRHWQIVLSVDVPYAAAVIKGTPAHIYPNEWPYMKLPPNPGFGRRRRHNVVRGQRPNTFLKRAARRTGRSHSSVRDLDKLFDQW